MTPTKSVLIITTSAHQLEDGVETGLWLGELTTPFYQLKDAGIEVQIASVTGGAIPIDESSIEAEKDEASVLRYQRDEDLKAALQDSPAFDTVDVNAYDALFFPGGHGAMVDYPNHQGLGRLIGDWLSAGKTLASVCHGPACLLAATDQDGISAIAGRTVTGFSNSEEHKSGLEPSVAFSLQDQLTERAGRYLSGDDFTAFAVQDKNLITGQNPQSAGHVGTLLVTQLLTPTQTDETHILAGSAAKVAA